MKEKRMRHLIILLAGILLLPFACPAAEEKKLDTVICGKETIEGECIAMTRYERTVRVEGWEKKIPAKDVDAITFATPSRMGVWGDKKKSSGVLKVLSYDGKKNEFLAEGESKPFDMKNDNWMVFGPIYQDSASCAVKGFKPEVRCRDEMPLALMALGNAYGQTFNYDTVDETLHTAAEVHADRIATVLRDLPSSLRSPQTMSYCTQQEKAAFLMRLLSAFADNRPAIINLHVNDNPKSSDEFKLVVGFDLQKNKILVINDKCFYEQNPEPRRIDIDQLTARVAVWRGEAWFLELEQPVPTTATTTK